MIRRKVSVGGEDFDKLRASGSYYIDKTELLYELAGETDNAVTLFTRPRRFGKTLNMSMMESFFNIEKAESKSFTGLSVMKHKEFCQKFMHRYPVLMISLKDVEGLDFTSASDMMKTLISDLFQKYIWLLDCSEVLAEDKKRFQEIISKNESNSDVKISLKLLMRMLFKHYDQTVILLIDEYDVPLSKASENDYYKEMLDLIRGFMSVSLKTNEYLAFAVVTGCLRMPKESIFTGVNNFASYSVLDEEFCQYFGFTDQEVKKMLTDLDLSDKADLIREWYDGYEFGNEKVYCPWDVISYVSALLKRYNAKPLNYWMNTSGNGAIKQFFDIPEIDVSEKFETLLNGGTILERVTDQLTYDNAYQSEQNLWSILLMTGYVTSVYCEDRDLNQPIELRIPNHEVASIFQSAVVDHFDQSVNRIEVKELMDALWNGKEKKASDIMSELLWTTISYMDYSEDYYHAFLTGLVRGMGYEVESNKERGLGRPDILVRDKRNRRAILIEAKRSLKQDQMEQDCRKAIRQIEENQYAENLYGYIKVNCCGIAFYKKSALVKIKQ